MVEIPAGSFNMGSPNDEPDGDVDEGPVHRVTIQRFALCRFEVTFAEYDAFALAYRDGGSPDYRSYNLDTASRASRA